MTHAEMEEDPLLRAIGEFRQELTRWIDSRIATLREHEGERVTSPESERPPPGLLDAGTKPAVPAGDSRNRLESLARHLDERMRGAEAAKFGPDRTAR
jgi:hypothetical protein